jgi:hypothetical protein
MNAYAPYPALSQFLIPHPPAKVQACPGARLREA